MCMWNCLNSLFWFNYIYTTFSYPTAMKPMLILWFTPVFLKLLYLLECKTRFFPLTLLLKYVRSYKFAYKAPNWTVPNQTALIWTMQGQTQACIVKLSSEICALLSYHTAESSNSLLMFWDNLSVPPSSVKKSKWGNLAQLKLTDTSSFFGTLSITWFFKEAQHFRSQLCFSSIRQWSTWLTL